MRAGFSPWDGARENLVWRLTLWMAGAVGSLLRRAMATVAERERGRAWAK
jgi:hypothetical protein